MNWKPSILSNQKLEVIGNAPAISRMSHKSLETTSKVIDLGTSHATWYIMVLGWCFPICYASRDQDQIKKDS